MTTELRVVLPGAEGSADARRALRIMSKVVDLLGALVEAGEDADGGQATWALTDLQMGSVVLKLAPALLPSGLTVADAEADLRLLVDGFDTAEEEATVPTGWNLWATRIGADLARSLGATKTLGMILGLVEDGEMVREVAVTRRAGDHLTAALNVRRFSVGSVVGKLEGVNTHRRRVARLWLEHPSCSVEVLFSEEQFEPIRAGLRQRVMISGEVERNAAGAPIRVRMRSLEILPSLADTPPVTDLVGLDPDLTGDAPAADYLREIRGASGQ